jgi:hypothetical protein
VWSYSFVILPPVPVAVGDDHDADDAYQDDDSQYETDDTQDNEVSQAANASRIAIINSISLSSVELKPCCKE